MARSYGTCLPRDGDGLLKYIGCPLNQGLNRMTRMLGDPHCVPDKEGNATSALAKHEARLDCMLESAKRNLQNMCVASRLAWCALPSPVSTLYCATCVVHDGTAAAHRSMHRL